MYVVTLVSAVADMQSGTFLSGKLYIRYDKRARNMAVLFLTDLSASTDEKINGRRVIDIKKEAMILMAEAPGWLSAVLDAPG
ncbi:MAG: hypothetical protein K9K82_11255 [Desulfobacteraceae bacterium]|nr:hypothetical protein [Desulfobacteraceae bacterium]